LDRECVGVGVGVCDGDGECVGDGECDGDRDRDGDREGDGDAEYDGMNGAAAGADGVDAGTAAGAAEAG
jgi:hypothetical protein